MTDSIDVTQWHDLSVESIHVTYKSLIITPLNQFITLVLQLIIHCFDMLYSSGCKRRCPVQEARFVLNLVKHFALILVISHILLVVRHPLGLDDLQQLLEALSVVNDEAVSAHVEHTEDQKRRLLPHWHVQVDHQILPAPADVRAAPELTEQNIGHFLEPIGYINVIFPLATLDFDVHLSQ